MPNMFGGDQMHPAYAPQAKVKANQVLVGDDLYTIELENRRVVIENVDGSQRIEPILDGRVHKFPPTVTEKYDALFEHACFMGGVGDEIWD